MTPEQAAELRKPFPKASVGVLPKPYKRESPKGKCGECGGWHGLPAAHLDYVGHAVTTDRLLAVDPEWTWEPLATDERGLPVPDAQGNLWIRLTVCGVTRIGVGDGASMKERIGDAIRNAAMRFGVALDLWSKEELEHSSGAVGALEKPQAAPPPPPNEEAHDEPEPPEPPEAAVPIKDRTRGRLFALLGERGIDDRAEQIRGIVHIIGRPIESRSELTEAEARQVIDVLHGAGQAAS